MIEREKKTLKFTDILELAKQGYTPSDIKELLSLNVNDTEVIPQEKELTEKALDTVESEQATLPEAESETPPVAEADSINYKELFEKSQVTINKLNKLLTGKNIEETSTQSETELLSELVRSFM